MSDMTVLVLVLWIVGVLLVFAQSVIAAIGPVAPGWVGLGLMGTAAALSGFPG